MRTRTFELQKLVRDNIVEQHMEAGAEVEHRVLSPKEKRSALINKIIEEAQELLESKKPVAEIADIQEALDQLAQDENLDPEQIRAQQEHKRTQNGGFENGDYIASETWPADHHWSRYYAADPDRFPEVKE